MRKISLPTFKSQIGLFSDIGGAIGFIGAIKAGFFSEWSSTWAFMLQLDWVLGTIAFWVLFGWLVLLLLFYDSLASVWQLLRWYFMDGSGRNQLGDLEARLPAPIIRWSGFVVFVVFWLTSVGASALTGGIDKKKAEQLQANIVCGLYLVVALGVGVYFGLTVKPEAVGPVHGWVIRLLGWLLLPVLFFLMCVLVLKGGRLLSSLIFSNDKSDQEAEE